MNKISPLPHKSQDLASIRDAYERLKDMHEEQCILHDQLHMQAIALDEQIQTLDETIRNLQRDNIAVKSQHNLLFENEYDARRNYYIQFLKSELSDYSREIASLFKNRTYKGIVVGLNAMHELSVQRHQRILKELAQDGYLCFLCESSEQFSIRELNPNLYVIAQQEYLLPVLQNTHVLVLNSWLIQHALIDCLPHRTLWYDVPDQVNGFSYCDDGMLLKHYEALHQADIITYSMKKLQINLGWRSDAIYLSGAVQTADVKAIEAKLQCNVNSLSIYANRSYDRHVSVFTATFLDYEGDNYYSGGAERYLMDLHQLCAELGYELDLYQYGNYSWYRKFRQINVYSLGHAGLNIHEFTMDALVSFNHRFIHTVDGRFDVNIYSAFFQAYPDAAHPSIGISHGVAWDHPQCRFHDPQTFWNSNIRYIESAKKLQKIISVDTNTPNWFQTVSFDTSMKMETIPNYVDPEEFHPDPDCSQNDKIRIVFPRRLYGARGLDLTLDIVDLILERYPQVEFHFVGKGFTEDLQKVEAKQKKWPGRVFRYHRDPDDMHQVYKNADIVLIPTLHSEGTSLSCLEACATGNTVIATRVGGLTDLIIDRYNGRLISPNSKELQEAIIECLNDPEMRQRLSRNAIEVSKAFNKDVWKQRWKQTLLESIQPSPGETDSSSVINRVKTVEIIGYSKEKADVASPLICDFLLKGYAVFIRAEKDDVSNPSFGRLQWISMQTELYFEPDEQLTLS
ncbi:glycosyltransferase family 4 protein [Paenibacillus sedimenti]|uniref:Glycosyltransferase family 4 protein n=1 Tax=Paenibacillus sedimenti TaxID=2770274 RepID=A0A926KSE2_9BACL|nr:glycosyltransferase family 4 protein [Paenibacillus sedimenti]MBD0382458.1 glycosyltransferase family 4 protein [Paenibacillus sedimenti]